MSDWISPQAATLLETLSTMNDTVRKLKQDLEYSRNESHGYKERFESLTDELVKRDIGTKERWGFKFKEEVK